MTEIVLSELEYLARQISICHADGRMEFGQRVLHRRFIQEYLAECRASAKQVRRIDEAFLHDPGQAMACRLTRFFEVKEQLQRARGRQGC